MKPVIILNGSGGVGKDTFVKFCGEKCNVVHFSTVDLIKKSAQTLGWKGGKTEKDRKFLSDLKVLAVDYCDLSYKYVVQQIDWFEHTCQEVDVMFVDSREPEEIARFAKIGCKTLLIINNNVGIIDSNMADANVLNYEGYDHVIDNSGTLEELQQKAHDFIDNLRCYE